MANKTAEKAAEPRVRVIDVENLEGVELRTAVKDGIETAMQRNLEGFVRNAVVDVALDVANWGVSKIPVKKWREYGKVVVKGIEMLIEQGMAERDSKDHKEQMLMVFNGVEKMYVELGEEPDQDKRKINKYLRKVKTNRALYTGKASDLEGIAKIWPVNWATQKVFDFAKTKLAKTTKVAITEQIDKLPLVNAGTVNEVMHLILLHRVAKLYNDHRDVEKKVDQARYSMDMVKASPMGAVKDAWNHVTSLSPSDIAAPFGVKI